jgi:hypothetical protein
MYVGGADSVPNEIGGKDGKAGSSPVFQTGSE